MPSDASSPKSPSCIVALGASAGGLEPLELFFQKVPDQSNMAFVVIQHLSPDYKSLMDEILARQTSMKINRVQDAMPVEANQIYLIPAKKEMVIENGKLKLRDKVKSEQLSMPIDIFFQSLAREAASKAVGIILSGSGSDGSRGVIELSKAGGLVLAQECSTARFDSMPQSAINSGAVDLVLEVEDMPAALFQYLSDPESLKNQKLDALSSSGELIEIFSLLQEKFQVNFDLYKQGTIVRRIERRMSLNRISTLEHYVDLLKNDLGELSTLYKDLLIGVTAFFRDQEAFKTLEQKVVTKLIKNHGEDGELRVWVAGCATGEEVYSLAISLCETMQALKKQVNIKIFATDVHRESLNVAAVGIYEKPTLDAISADLIIKWFIELDNDKYQVNPELRKMVVFAEHDVLKDPPFTKISLLTCRNLLIYMQPAAQHKILSLFHFALIKGAYLFLGPSESLSDLDLEFEIIDKHWKIFKKKRDTRLGTHLRFPLASTLGTTTNLISTRPLAGPVQLDQRLIRAYDTILEKYVAKGFLINEHHALIHSFGDAGELLQTPRGRMSVDVLNMVEGELKIALAAALQRAARERTTVNYKGVKCNIFDPNGVVSITVDPLPDKISDSLYFFVIFIPETPETPPEQIDHSFKADAASGQRIRDLEVEIRNLRENLQATVEELETSNEELQASNEELVASNEELQSTNEELHSVNEELYTVNAEYEQKIEELTNTTNDLSNLLDSTEIGTFFLDHKFCIRKFTQPTTKVFNVLPQDIGRPFDHISHALQLSGLQPKLEKVFTSGVVHEEEVLTKSGIWYLLRILPYINDMKETAGLVLTLTDIDDLKKALEDSKQLAIVADESLDAIMILDADHKIVSWNRGAEKMYGWNANEIKGADYEQLVPLEKRLEIEELFDSLDEKNLVESFESTRLKRTGESITVWLTLTSLVDIDKEEQLISVIERDITQLKQAEKDRGQLTQQLHQSHKMRALGTLTSGIAHEFNNLIQTISGQVEYLFLNEKVVEEEAVTLSDIKKMTIRAQELVQGMMTFSHQQNGGQEVIEINSIVVETARLIEKIVPKNISIEVHSSHEYLYMLGDQGQVQQIILNLATNSRDAMPDGGTFTVTIGLRKITEKDTATIGDSTIDPGEYIDLSVSDTGKGIDKDELNQIFNPFFTTKPIGQGTGMGLSIVYGITQQLNAYLDCESSPGKGTTFHILFPAVKPSKKEQKIAEYKKPIDTPEIAFKSTGRGDTILIVDDEHLIRKMSGKILEKAGFKVLLAESAEQAINLYRENRDHIECVVLDLGLPGMGGDKCLKDLLILDPEVRVIVASGYLNHPIAKDPEKYGAKGFLSKPYGVKELAKKIRHFIDS